MHSLLRLVQLDPAPPWVCSFVQRLAMLKATGGALELASVQAACWRQDPQPESTRAVKTLTKIEQPFRLAITLVDH